MFSKLEDHLNADLNLLDFPGLERVTSPREITNNSTLFLVTKDRLKILTSINRGVVIRGRKDDGSPHSHLVLDNTKIYTPIYSVKKRKLVLRETGKGQYKIYLSQIGSGCVYYYTL